MTTKDASIPKTGADAEARAAEYLQQQGLRLLRRNFRCRLGEIDLILQDGETRVFVEVRARSRQDFGGAAASITPAKQRRLIAAAQIYLMGLAQMPVCRFDAVLIGPEGLEWIRSAFDAA